MLADALVVGREFIFLPVVNGPQNLTVLAIEADQFARIAYHIKTVIVDYGSRTCFPIRLRPCISIDHLPGLCSVQLVASQLFFLLVLGKTCSIDKSVAYQCTGVTLSCIICHPQFLGAFGRPLFQEIFLIGKDSAVIVPPEGNLLGLEPRESEKGKSDKCKKSTFHIIRDC